MKKTLAVLTLAALALCPCLALGQTPLVNSTKMIADGIVTEPKLSVAVQAKLNAAYALIPTVQALGVSTAAISAALGTETANRIAADYAVGASTEALAIALLDEYNERVAADLAIGVDTAALNASKVAKAGDSMSGSLSFTVPVTGINWQDGSVSTTGNIAVDTSGLLEKTGGTMTGPLIVNSTLQASTVTVTEILKMVRSTPTTDAVKTDEIFKVGTRETNGRPGLQFYPPCQGGQCGVFKLGLQASGEGDPFDRDSDGFIAMNPTKNRSTSLGTMGYDFSCMRVTQGDNFGAEYVRVCEDGISLSTGPNAENRTVAFDTANGSGTFKGQLQASTFVAVGSAFIVGDSSLTANQLWLGDGSVILDSLTGTVYSTYFTGDGSNITAIAPVNISDGVKTVTGGLDFYDPLSTPLMGINAGSGGSAVYIGYPVGAGSYSLHTTSSILVDAGAVKLAAEGLLFSDGTSMQTAASGGGALVSSTTYLTGMSFTSGGNPCTGEWYFVADSTASLTLAASGVVEISLNVQFTQTAGEALRIAAIVDGSVLFPNTAQWGETWQQNGDTAGYETRTFMIQTKPMSSGAHDFTFGMCMMGGTWSQANGSMGTFSAKAIK